MKLNNIKQNRYIVLSLVVLLGVGCKEKIKKQDHVLPDTTKPSFAIDATDLKQRYTPNEILMLRLRDDANRPIDSVIYYVNEREIAKVRGNDSVRYVLSDGKFGIQILKAIVYSDGEIEEDAVRVDFLPSTEPQLRSYKLINTYPHDSRAYTQGLEFYREHLIESTGNGEGPSGNKGISSVRIVNATTGEIIKKLELDDAIFGEGATVLGDKLYQLTYKNNEAYVYDIRTLEKVQTLPYFQYMEGWG